MTSSMPNPLTAYTLSLNEAAVLLDVSTKTIQRAVKAGRLSCIRVAARRGHELRFRLDEVRTLTTAFTPPRREAAPSDSPAPAEAQSPETPAKLKDDRKAARERKTGQRAPMDEVAARLAATGARLEGLEMRLGDLNGQQGDLLATLADLPRLSRDVQISLAQQQDILDALNGLPRQLAAYSERLAGSAAEAAAYRERAAWLEGTLAETSRELAALRLAQIAPPGPPAVPAEPEPEPEPEPPTETAVDAVGSPPPKTWWRRLIGG